MIRIEVEDYCHSCRDFSPDVTAATRNYAVDDISWTDTVVRCEHAKKCAGLVRYLENQIKNKTEAAG